MSESRKKTVLPIVLKRAAVAAIVIATGSVIAAQFPLVGDEFTTPRRYTKEIVISALAAWGVFATSTLLRSLAWPTVSTAQGTDNGETEPGEKPTRFLTRGRVDALVIAIAFSFFPGLLLATTSALLPMVWIGALVSCSLIHFARSVRRALRFRSERHE